ncbi:FGGY-family carbohydrate kinase [Pantoea sp. 1.19]|uniref:FGGY-family carbohydrate kinase n=1 Tax=Pantoea sp. 1.19 TaxID=1925589 RepID=UPI000948CB05|nr:FGGY-family carbohydrate kinase [Pantoea sp. 1.19]
MSGEAAHSAQTAERVFIGIDVGTASARAGVFDGEGTMRASARRAITLYRGTGQAVEQSGDEIWQAIAGAVREAVSEAGVDPAQVGGIGFDATCSLVVVGEDGAPLAVGDSEDPQRNIIVWMDHRATREAEQINATQHPVLRYVGGRLSPEMEPPKLLWLKTHRRHIWDRAWQFFDLADYLTWRASGDLARSTCTVTCKWTYLAHESRWDPDFFHQAGLGDLAEEGFRRIGQRMHEPGTACGNGLTERAARELGLPVGTPVAAGMIDAHAGGIGTAGAQGDAQDTLAYVFGTSSCTMTSSPEPVFIPGVWGPYYSAMVPGLWLNEGGQSAAGAAIDRLLGMHPAAAALAQQAQAQGCTLPVLLADRVLARVAQPSDAVALIAGLHVVPEFLGNRAPFADPRARAAIAGLDMSEDDASLLALYVAGICSIGYGLRQIIDVQTEAGATVRQIAISGGAGQHPLVRQLLADATGIPLLATRASEPVLLGAGILGACAGGLVSSVSEGMARFTRAAAVWTPSAAQQTRHQRRYQAFLHLQASARDLQAWD